MENPAVQKLVDEWRKTYKSENPLQALREIDGNYPPELVEEMNQSDFLLPEPFYGPFEQNMKNDLLILLMNPGQVEQQVKYAPIINQRTIERYSRLKRNDFLQECGRLDQEKISIPRNRNICDTSCVLHDQAWDGCRWRRIRYREAKFDVKLSFDLLNTMEYIPYHSKRYNDLASIQEWMHNANSTKMAFDAVREIAKNRLVKHIVSLGGAWIRIMKSHGYLPVEDKTIRSSSGSVLGRLLKYQITESALPIVIHLIAAAVKFPARPSVINEMRRMLGEPKIDGSDPSDIIQDNL
jgi:hypothetical protein